MAGTGTHGTVKHVTPRLMHRYGAAYWLGNVAYAYAEWGPHTVAGVGARPNCFRGYIRQPPGPASFSLDLPVQAI